jgi:hypothetical protein
MEVFLSVCEDRSQRDSWLGLQLSRLYLNPGHEEKVGPGVIVGDPEQSLTARHEGLRQGQVPQAAEIRKIPVKQIDTLPGIPGGIGKHPDPAEGIDRDPLDRGAFFRKGILTLETWIAAPELRDTAVE